MSYRSISYGKQCPSGQIEVICGGMFAGKTEELHRRLKRAVIGAQNVQVYKPECDTRYSADDIVTHDGNSVPCSRVSSAMDLLHKVDKSVDVIAIDEAQFMDANVVDVVGELADLGYRVIVAGLDQDYNGLPFGPMPQLMAVADFVTKLHAVCPECGCMATKTYRKTKTTQQRELGGKGTYAACCRACYNRRRQYDREVRP